MSDYNKLIIQNENKSLKKELELLKENLNQIEQETATFEKILRSHLIDEIIEVQELTSLYKEIKVAKKEQRLVQKQKGKNYKASNSLKLTPKKTNSAQNKAEKKELKRLYREAILHVHPDKFNLNDEQSDLSTEITTQLIEIYQKGNLNELQAFHTQIFTGQTNISFSELPNIKTSEKDNNMYLKLQLQKLNDQITSAKNRHTYQVLTEYEDPMNFIDELKTYYMDRIVKLKKRTRTK